MLQTPKQKKQKKIAEFKVHPKSKCMNHKIKIELNHLDGIQYDKFQNVSKFLNKSNRKQELRAHMA